MREFVLIGLGAIFGANARYWLANAFAARFGQDFPYGTLLINVTGSFALGFLLTLIGNRLVADPGFRLALGTGFLGAYTTFSTFSYDTMVLLERDGLGPAALNSGASLAGSLLAAYLGIMLARLVG